MQISAFLLASTSGPKETSKEAFSKLVANGHFKNRQEQITYWLGQSKEPLSRRDLAQLMGVEASSLSHPIRVLLDSDTITLYGKKKHQDTRHLAESFTLKTSENER